MSQISAGGFGGSGIIVKSGLNIPVSVNEDNIIVVGYKLVRAYSIAQAWKDVVLFDGVNSVFGLEVSNMSAGAAFRYEFRFVDSVTGEIKYTINPPTQTSLTYKMVIFGSVDDTTGANYNARSNVLLTNVKLQVRLVTNSDTQLDFKILSLEL